MSKRKMIIAQDLQEKHLTEIRELASGWEVIAGRDESVWRSHLADAEIIAGWKKGMEETCLHESSKLRWVQSWSAGVNSMPLQALAKKEVLLTSANGVHANPISETIFALMLGLTRKIHAYVRNQSEKKWHHENMKLEIHGKTLGVIGVGAIGQETAKIAKAFEMTVLGVRHSGKPADFVDEMYTQGDLNTILPRCDYVAVTVPLTSDTERLFTYEQFKQMKPSAYFINIGRGEVVEEAALIQALAENEIAGAGLDVFEHEPLGVKSPLWEFENVIITPHTSGSTEFYNERLTENILIPNLKTYLSDRVPSVNFVDYKKGY
ncbi:D-2-hydroxyacid dehydrogenase [Metabacillus indicus]|uniref:D-2-hydroxyacid dehydrogenase n=1 Tax=Metabacillus indicus TaxID=246786 RepID=UPI0004937D6E|nr:D-2-hydroxyacid dehydrogenase [Metabacillus indicus]KEZ48130.1 2-hydroxyacid dehydrogenase [Metabacillus indicus LMG 22858]